MRVFSLSTLRKFWQAYPDAEAPLRRWYRHARHETWKNIQQVRVSYPHADGVRLPGGQVLTVFNVCGNKYRLIVDIQYAVARIYVQHVLTHAEYDRNRWKE